MHLEMYKYVHTEKWKKDQYSEPMTVRGDHYKHDDRGAFEISFIPEEWVAKGAWSKRVARLIVNRKEAKELGELLLKLE
jgi:hypothetical protein